MLFWYAANLQDLGCAVNIQQCARGAMFGSICGSISAVYRCHWGGGGGGLACHSLVSYPHLTTERQNAHTSPRLILTLTFLWLLISLHILAVRSGGRGDSLSLPIWAWTIDRHWKDSRLYSTASNMESIVLVLDAGKGSLSVSHLFKHRGQCIALIHNRFHIYIMLHCIVFI